MMQKTGIEWADYSWNPVSGCRHGCEYCYARKMAVRYKRSFEPAFHEKKLYELKETTNGVVFCGSNCDLWGSWVDQLWIGNVLHVARFATKASVMMLTKNPARYNDFKDACHDNIWLGTTLDAGYKNTAPPVGDRVRDITNLEYPRKWLSIEPFSVFQRDFYMGVVRAAQVQWVVIGVQTPVNNRRNPPSSTLNTIHDMVRMLKERRIPVFIKNSVYELGGNGEWTNEKWPREFPDGVRLATKSPEWKPKEAGT